jgi:hypothetical protein
MPYIGNPIYQSAFVTDTFSGNGSTTAFTMSVAPAGVSNVLVAVSGVLQDPSTYGVVGNTITFSAAPPTGTNNISCRYLGVPATGVTTTAYRTQTEFTATAGQTTFTPPSYTVGFIDVYRNGALLGSADFTATNGTTVVLTNAASEGDLIETVSFLVSSVLNALPLSGGNLSGNLNLTAGNLGFTGTAQRITGDFSNATDANKVLFQTSTATSATILGVIPNGAVTSTGVYFFNDPSTLNCARFDIGLLSSGTEARISSTRVGSGTYLPLTMYTGGSERLRIDTSGNVGIGTSSPTQKLEVNGSVLASNFLMSPAAGTYGKASDTSIEMATSADATPRMLFRVGGTTERMRINSNGGLLLSTTSAIWSANERLTVQATGAGAVATFRAQQGATEMQIIFKGTNDALAGYIQVGTTSTSYITSSDYRLKENITPMTGALGIVQQLKPVTYKWKVDGSSGQGFIAHELQEFVPEAVCGNKDDVTEDGSIKPQGIDTSFLVATLTAAIQELKTELDNVKTELAALKGATE